MSAVNKNITAVIFDLDGTILDTLDDLTDAVNFALNKLGYAELTRDVVRRFVGNGIKKLTDRALVFSQTCGKAWESNSEITNADECYALCIEYYSAHSADKTGLYPGIKELLDELKAHGIKTAVVTNKNDDAAQRLHKMMFSSVDYVAGVKNGIRPKPAPDGVKAAMKALGADKSKTLYVGDGETDMETAKNCGLTAVAVTWGFRDKALLQALRPDYIIDNPSELTDIIG